MKNERIQELVEQATVATDQELHRLSQGIEGMPSRLDLFNQKFAELIVEKCAQASEVYWNDAGLQRAFSPSEYIYTMLGVE